MVRVGDTLIDHGAHAVGDVILHQAAPLAVARTLEGVPESRRAAELGLQYRVTARGKELHEPVELREVARLRAAVRQYHERYWARLLAGRHGEVCRDGGAVMRLVGNLLELAERHILERWIALGGDVRPMRRKIDEVINWR